MKTSQTTVIFIKPYSPEYRIKIFMGNGKSSISLYQTEIIVYRNELPAEKHLLLNRE
jgi:hypothetical protein